MCSLLCFSRNMKRAKTHDQLQQPFGDLERGAAASLPSRGRKVKTGKQGEQRKEVCACVCVCACLCLFVCVLLSLSILPLLGSASEKLKELLIRFWACGALDAKAVCSIAYWASKAGAENLEELALNPNSDTGAFSRHLRHLRIYTKQLELPTQDHL